MDIFGVGAAELILIAILMLVVAGPKRSAQWARQAGLYLRKFRQAWQQMMDDLQKDLGEEGRELLNTAQDLARTTVDVRRTVSPHNIVQKAMAGTDKLGANQPQALDGTQSAKNGGTPQSKYAAWTMQPPDQEQIDDRN
jgi:Sec-independent protein translocase protein TatA